MQATEHKTCYGTMFPRGRPTPTNEAQQGKVFSLEAISPIGLSPPRRRANIDLLQWDDCLTCPEFDHCYRLCLAKLALEEAVGNW